MSPNQYELLSAHRALEGLVQTTGLQSQVLSHNSDSHDGQVVITSGDGRSFDLPYDVKTTIDRRDQLLSFEHRHDGLY